MIVGFLDVEKVLGFSIRLFFLEVVLPLGRFSYKIFCNVIFITLIYVFNNLLLFTEMRLGRPSDGSMLG